MLKLISAPVLLLLPLSLTSLTACSKRFTPWDIKVPKEYTDLTQRNLEKLAALPEARLPVKIALTGDPQGTPGDLERVVKAIESRGDIRFIMVLGDITDYGLMHEYLWAAEALENSSLPHLTVIGNHDAIAHGKRIYSQMYGPYDYVFEDAGVRFIMFNTNQYEFGRTDFTFLKNKVDERSITASHVPPVEDMHSLDQVKEWTGINTDASIMASVHGHRGGTYDVRWSVDKIPYYIVPRVRGVYYSVMTIHEDYKVSFQKCSPECEEETP